MNQPAPRIVFCPGCGAQIEFKVGASRATVCAFCRTVVVRKGQDFEAIGKVADLIPTGSKLDIGSRGALDNVPFEVLGRLQYQWNQGVWDEWYVAFADGRWGWLAEAQGRFYITFKVSPRPLPQTGVVPGASFFIEGLGRFVVSDVKHATIVGVQGELPDPVQLGASPYTADMESERGGFATLDGGVNGEPPSLYVGRQVPFEALKLGVNPGLAAPRAARPDGEKLACPNCGRPITVRLPTQTVRVICESCNHLLDCGHGPFRVIAAVERGQTQPKIPLGTAGTLRSRQVMVVGWMVRSCTVDNARYGWSEYLLWEDSSQSFSWLVESDEGHWQLATPISVAAVNVADDAEFEGRRFRHFSTVLGRVELVLGEFYWAISAGDESQLEDYVAPPEGLSCESSRSEVNWTHLRHLEPGEVGEAFAQPEIAQATRAGVGAIQPWPHEATWRSMSHWMWGGVAGIFVLMVLFALRPTQVFVDRQFSSAELTNTDADVGPGGEHVFGFISPSFDLTRKGALRIELTSDVSQTWAYAGGAVISEESGVSAPFGVESSYYSGVDQGESWSEGDRQGSTSVASPGKGPALVRADLQWEPGHPPPNLHLKVRSDSFSGWQFLGFTALLFWPVIYAVRRKTFEKARWAESNVHPSTPQSGED